MMNEYLVFILTLLLLSYLLELVVAQLNLHSLSPELPSEFAGVYDAEQYAKSQDYTRTTTRFLSAPIDGQPDLDPAVHPCGRVQCR